MRINPSEIRVDYGNGQSVTLESDAHWERVREYIDRLFQWDKSYPGDPVVPQERATTEQAIMERPAKIAPPTATLDPNLRIIDRIVIALGKSGKSLDTKKIYQSMVEDGYVNKAIKPENNVHSKGRKYPEIVKMTRGVFSLLPAGVELFRQLEKSGFRRLLADDPKTSEDASEYPPLMPVERQATTESDAGFPRRAEVTGGDYLLQALYQLGGSASLDELIDPMIGFGWRPSSATRIKKRHNVSALAYTNREFVSRNGGRISLNDKGIDRLFSRVNEGILIIDNGLLNRPQNPDVDVKESNTGLFIQT